MTDESETAARGGREKQPDKVASGCGLIAGGAVALFGLFVVWAMVSGGDSSSDEPSGYMAEVMCEDFVEDRLKAPSTAEFSTSHSGTGPTYTVTGTVDAENSFGAMTRNEFTCTVRYEGDDRWQLVSLDGLG